MLAKQHRLRERELFQKLFSSGKRAFCDGAVGFSLPRKDGTLVVGVTFKQKMFPRAVTRHWYKRRVYAWARAHQGAWRGASTVIVHFQQPLPTPTYSGVAERLDTIFKSLHLL